MFSFRFRLMPGLLAAVLLAACASVPPDTAQQAAPPLRLFTPLPEVFTAGQPGAEDWRGIAAKGVTTVINLRLPEELEGRDERSEVANAGMAYVEVPVAGAKGLSMEKAQELRAAILASDGPVLVHCAAGNRAGALLALSLAQAGMTDDAAMEIGRAAGMTAAEETVREVLRTAPTREPESGDREALCAMVGKATCDS